ncbi:MAG: hypothetical protein J5725_04285 [Bacteroidales bacterium]|nr:hypothetical protein [Bacteroidales bacterium]
MKPSSPRKVFGIISYFPNNDTEYHIETRRERTRRFKELLYKLEEYWADTDIMVIAQNWQDFELPNIKNKIITYHYDRLGILGARRELRKQFLASDYDYLIMLDDDGRVLNADADLYMQTIDEHPDGIGVIRHRSCPLMFLAISKAIYSQIDMPDIDPEKSEGFEDDIFVANCFAQFPDKAYDFPENCIEEFSLKYTGPGACPSTWAKEKKYDWEYMRAFTNSKLHAINYSKSSDNPIANTQLSTSDIDVVITYVNSSDQNWTKDFIKTTKVHNITPVRYRSWGTLKYLLRGISLYMPFVRNVLLVVSRLSQVPIWLNTKNVRVVYHEDFIPKKYLPTFNSCTIESFFWNIPDLADRIIYFNDDIFPVSPMTEEDFFTGTTPHIKFLFYEKYNKQHVYRAQCRSGMDLVSDFLKIDRLPDNVLVCPEHTASPMLKSVMQQVGTECLDRLCSAITKLRTPQNVNQYIYMYPHYFTNNYDDNIAEFKYFDVREDNIQEVMDSIVSDEYQIICLNDSDKLKNFTRVRYMVDSCFKHKFPDKCKYEA